MTDTPFDSEEFAAPDNVVQLRQRPTIQLVGGEISSIVDEAEAALIAVADLAPVMARAGFLVQPITVQMPASHGHMTDMVLLRRLTTANVVYLLNKHAAIFKRFDLRRNKWRTVDPPLEIADQLLEKGHWKFPTVAGVVTTPTLRADGSILDRPGYDQATQLWYQPDSNLVLPKLKVDPTREQAEQALALLTELLKGFPFDSNLDRAVVLSTILTAVLRGAFDVTPMTLLQAPDAGSGKSYLADLISTIARGRACPVITNVGNAEEMEKRLGALILEGAPIISLDNCSSDIGGDLLCQITERRLIRPRILGKSKVPECEWRGVLLATGNNVMLVGELIRRGLVAKLDAKMERPELRTFAFDPIARVQADRGSYIAAAITIARAYIAAGSPRVCGPFGSYEPWSRMIRSPLIWLGEADPVKCMEETRQEDTARRAERELIALWRDNLGTAVSYTAAALIKTASEQRCIDHTPNDTKFDWRYPRLRELLALQCGNLRGEIEAKKVGNWLTRMRGRVHDGHCIMRVKESASWGHTYALQRRDSQGEAGDQPEPADGG
jgi:hypothetical protein